MARRGIPRQIISDNAKHFKTAEQMLSRAKLHHVDEYLSKKGIYYKFIVELAPWMGGFYE